MEEPGNSPFEHSDQVIIFFVYSCLPQIFLWFFYRFGIQISLHCNVFVLIQKHDLCSNNFFHCINLFSFCINPFWVTMWFLVWFEPQSVMKHIVHYVLRCQELGSYIFTIKCFLSLLGVKLKLDHLVAQQLLTKYTYEHVILIIKKFLFLQKLFYKLSTNSQILDPRKKTLYSILCCVVLRRH